MPSNAELIEMHLNQMLQETEQYGTLDWGNVMAFCIGYYETITLDHIIAIRNLESTGAIIKE